jgi:predicted dehydrogenase
LTQDRMNTSHTKLSRRSFLQQSATVLGAALAAPTVIPASALGRGGVKSPSERITMGFIGVGGQGGGHLLGGAWTYVPGGYSARRDVQVLAVCDAWKDRRENATRRVNENYAEVFRKDNYRSCEAYRDFRDVLARTDIDAVLIATPIHWHGVMTIMAAKAGKDIYCEKPTAITIRESQVMKETVLRYGRVFQGGTQQRSEYGGKFRRACELVRNGAIGQLKEVYACRPGGAFAWNRYAPAKPVPAGLDWDLALGPAPWQEYAGVAHAHMFMGVGDINWGPHHYDFIQWVLDADRSGPVELFIEKNMLQYRYANGVVVHGEHFPGDSTGSSGGARLIGTDGWIAVDREHLTASSNDILQHPLDPNGPRVYFSDSHSGNFLDCVRTRKRPICDIETAHRSASAVILGGIALQLNRKLKWDPLHEQFINDDKANRLLSTAFRTPWVI